MTTDGEKWHYLAGKKGAWLCREITVKPVGDFYCLNCFHSYSTKKKLGRHYNVCKIHTYYDVKIPNEDSKILKYNHGGKSMKVSFIIYPDVETLLEKMSTCHDNPEKSSTTKISIHLVIYCLQNVHLMLQKLS